MSDSRKNRIVVLSGPSGSGKTTLVRRLVDESPVPLIKSVSATTRNPRPAEVPGDDYHFLTDADFRDRLRKDEFIEHAEVFSSGFLYGTLRSELDRAWARNAWAFLEIDVQGAMQVIQKYPEAITIFLKTPSPEEFERRLRHRGTETEENIRKRLATAAKEVEMANQYQYVVVNDLLDQAVSEICEILRVENSRS
ncbi:MAG: guanylate kinase [Planctomyces sp.]